jgi:hypothetical protein
MMESMTFSGKDQFEVRQKLEAWRRANPNLKIVKIHPAEYVPPKMNVPSPNHGPLPPAQDRVSVKIDFESSN